MKASSKPRRAPGLSHRAILEAALALVDRDGAGALTMRRLAAELDVAAMSLYNHVPGREGLLDGLSEVMVERIGVDAGEDNPRRLLRRFAAGIRAVANAHPAAFQLVGMRPLHTRASLVPIEATLDALRRIGLDGEEAVHAYRALASYARGFALSEIAGFTLESRPRPAQPAPDPGSLPPENFPNLVELAPWLADPDRDAAFELGTELLLDGIDRRAGA